MADGTKFHWTLFRGTSVRCFEFVEAPTPASCVSLRSSEFTVVLDGELLVEYGPASQRVRVGPYEGCVITRGTPHRSYSTSGTKIVIVDCLGGDFGPLGIGKFSASSLRRDLLRSVEQCYDGTLDAQAFSECGRHAELLSPTIRAMERRPSTAGLFRLKAMLDENFRSPISVAELAKWSRLDIDYLIREFRKNFLFTPLAYVNFVRLRQFAWSTLEAPREQGLMRTALDSGFNDYSTFCRRVRSEYGRPPSRLVRPLPNRPDATEKTV